jgi:hypothetical protein
MGPDDSYLLQYSKDVRSFWADPHALALGACFRPRGTGRPAAPLQRIVPEVPPRAWQPCQAPVLIPEAVPAGVAAERVVLASQALQPLAARCVRSF